MIQQKYDESSLFGPYLRSLPGKTNTDTQNGFKELCFVCYNKSHISCLQKNILTILYRIECAFCFLFFVFFVYNVV